MKRKSLKVDLLIGLLGRLILTDSLLYTSRSSNQSARVTDEMADINQL